MAVPAISLLTVDKSRGRGSIFSYFQVDAWSFRFLCLDLYFIGQTSFRRFLFSVVRIGGLADSLFCSFIKQFSVVIFEFLH